MSMSLRYEPSSTLGEWLSGEHLLARGQHHLVHLSDARCIVKLVPWNFTSGAVPEQIAESDVRGSLRGAVEGA